ncbi:MAG: hypothetical protein NE328_16395 [Lentisphaeraceae bacterium]|nr:hypothetical protein [Lentisphaeraceae bacterium]
MEEKKKVKILLMLLLLTSCVAAFCLGTLAFTMATGELPFDIKVPEQFLSDIPKKQPKYKAAEIPIEDRTPDELTLRSLHDELQEKKAKLTDREEDIKESIKTMEQLVSNANDIEAKTSQVLEDIKKERMEKVKEIQDKLDKLQADTKAFKSSQSNLDAQIINRIATVLADMPPASAMLILSDLDAVETARMLNEMQIPNRSAILEQLVTIKELYGKPLSTTDQLSFRKKANEIVLELRKLKEKPYSERNPTGVNP